MQIKALVFALLPLLALAQEPAAAGEDVHTVGTSTETHTRTIKVSQISTITSVISSTHAANTTSTYPTSTHASYSASAPVITTGGAAPSSTEPAEFEGAASNVKVSFGVMGVMAAVAAALL